MKHTILALAFTAVAMPAIAQHESECQPPQTVWAAAQQQQQQQQQQRQTAQQQQQQPRPPALTPPVQMNEALPPGTDEFIKLTLARSPRHHEWVDVPMSGGGFVRAFVVFPESKDRTGVVIVLHENRGLNDWARAVADQLAEDGFIAIAPDMLTGKGPGGGHTDSIPPDQATRAIGQLANDEVNLRLDAVREYAIQIPSGNGRVGMIGFCWGGGKVFQYAAHRPALNAGVVYYGPAPGPEVLAKIYTPLLGFFGELDNRVNSTINLALPFLNRDRVLMKTHLFPGAGHAFLRQQFRSEGDLNAAVKAWPITIAFLKEHLK